MKNKFSALMAAFIMLFACQSKKPDPVPAASGELPKAEAKPPQTETPEMPASATLAQQAPQAPTADPQWLSQMQSTIAQLESLSASGRAEASPFKESTDVPDRSVELAALVASWDSWVRSWDARLDAAPMPPQPMNAPDACQLAYSEVQQASNELHQVSASGSDSTVPTKNQRNGHFDRADTHLRQARDYLNRIT